MLPIRLLSGSFSHGLRKSTISIARRTPLPFQATRWKGTSPTIGRPETVNNKFIFPQRLIVYHAGTGRSVFVGCMKVTTIFIFSFFCLVVAPAHWFAEGDSKLVASAIMLSGVIPMAFVAYVSGPFVAHVHLRLPHYARKSREILNRYTKNLPKEATLEITTMKFIGTRRLSVVKVGDLKPAKERFGMVNYIRDTAELDSKRRWYMGKEVRQFGLHGGVKLKGDPGVWDNIVKAIKKS